MRKRRVSDNAMNCKGIGTLSISKFIRCMPENSKGFSLLEVIIALAVLAIGIACVLRVYSSSIVAVRDSESYSTASMLANRVALALDKETELNAGEQSGDFDDSPNYRWKANIGSADDNGLVKILITIFWGDDGKSQSFNMVTYLHPSSDSTTTGSDTYQTSGGA
ncbi:MAG: type IV pilus modification PilV family protein [Armatimonadota bacterium]